MENIEYFECECCNPEHTIRFHVDNEDNIIYMTTHLSHQPFFKRVLTALKYIFKCDNKWGTFEETIINQQQASRMVSVLQQITKHENNSILKEIHHALSIRQVGETTGLIAAAEHTRNCCIISGTPEYVRSLIKRQISHRNDIVVTDLYHLDRLRGRRPGPVYFDKESLLELVQIIQHGVVTV